MKEITVHGITIQLIKENWMMTTYQENSLINAGILEELRDAYTALNGSDDLSNLRLIQVFKGGIDITRDIGERYITNRIRTKVGEALVTSDAKTLEYLNGASAVMGRTHPVRVFPSIEAATDWLESL